MSLLQMMTRLIQVWVQRHELEPNLQLKVNVYKKWVCLLGYCKRLWFNTITQRSYNRDVDSWESTCVLNFIVTICVMNQSWGQWLLLISWYIYQFDTNYESWNGMNELFLFFKRYISLKNIGHWVLVHYVNLNTIYSSNLNIMIL
jgi:hypothetical protein